MADRLRAYRGAEPYLFISYAHKDGADVVPAIEALAAKGFRIWYDEGIEAGDDWSERIGRSLENAAQVLFFASKSSVKSENVRREIKFAAERGIPVLTVQLGKVSLPAELQRLLLVNQTVDLSRFATYGEFAASVEPVLKRSGAQAAAGDAESAPAADRSALARRVSFAAKKKGRRVLAVVLIVLACLAALLFGLFRLFFRDVPAVVGLPAEEAREKIEAAGLDCTLSLNYSDEYDYGVVFAQSAEGRVLKFVPVVVTQSLGPEDDLTDVPDTVGRHVSEGAKLLVAAGITKFTISPEIPESAIPELAQTGNVLRQSIPAGLRVSKKNPVELTVATDGEDLTVEIDGRQLTLRGTEPVRIDLSDPDSWADPVEPEPAPGPEPEPEPEPEPVDEDGLTAAERALFESIPPYIGYSFGGGRPLEEITPYADAETLKTKHPAHATACIVRDMTVDGVPEWTEGFAEFIVAPGVTLTIDGTWGNKNFGENVNITVLEGGTLIIDGDLYLSCGANHGTVIVNGSIRYKAADNGYSRGRLANDGALIVNGSCSLLRLWRFAGSSVSGSVDAAEVYDHTGLRAPFAYTNGQETFQEYEFYYLDNPDGKIKKWW